MTAVVIERSAQTGAVWWLPLGLGVAGLMAALVMLYMSGPRHRSPLRRITTTLARLTGLPAWSAAGIALTLWSLAVAFIGFAWDVAWHADLGRDTALFTPPHVMILVGLAGIALSGLASIALATRDRADVGLRAGALRAPWSALALGVLAAGALCGFPLDDWWHATYGIDVTMWSPTHLLMIGGASLTPIAAWLMLAEAGVSAGRGAPRRINALLAAAVLLGLSTFQLEFDMGIPQWQVLYHPVLLAIAMGVGLVAAREALGRGGALRTMLAFIALRGVVALLIGPVFGLSVERFPLYIAGALGVEAVYLLGARWTPLQRAFAAGLVIGTAGMAAEWAWTWIWGLQPWQPRLLWSWWLVIAVSLIAALLGCVLGRAVAQQRQPLRVRSALLLAALLGLALAVPFPRHGADAVATVRATPAGPVVPAITREGMATLEQDVRVSVQVSPQSAVESADIFRVVAWQGGGIVVRPLRDDGHGTWTADGVVPTGGAWKSLVFLSSGDVVSAVPVQFPADNAYALPALDAPLQSPRVIGFAPASTYLTRESHGGAALAAVFAYAALALMTVVWFVALIGAGDAVGRQLRRRLTVHGLVGHGGHA